MELGEIQSYWITPEESMHYRDYDNGYAALSFLEGVESYGQLVVGSQSHRVVCGSVHSHRHSTKCRECSSVAVCKGCGRVVPIDVAHYMEEAIFCREYVAQCELCGSWIHADEAHQAISRRGRIVRLCEQCHTSATGNCGLCSSREICQIINAGRFCPHVEFTGSAAA